MRIKALSKLLAISLLAVTASHCGLLGSAPQQPGVLVYQSGCLNNAGPQIDRYIAGEISSDEWGAAWDCAINSISTLQRYTATGRTGYSVDDIQWLISSVVWTNQNIPRELVQAAFHLKASLFGGSGDELTVAELGAIANALRTMKAETTALIPDLANRANHPSPASMLALADHAGSAMKNIAAAFPVSSTSSPLVKSDVRTIITDLGNLLGHPASPTIAPGALIAKQIFAGGAADRVESTAWPLIMNASGTLGGAYLALISARSPLGTAPNEYGEFLYQIAARVFDALSPAIDAHQGSLDLGLFDRLVDDVPAGIFPVSNQAIEVSIDALVNRIFASGSGSGLDHATLQAMLAALDRWRRGQTHLETIYRKNGFSGDGPTLARWDQAAADYEAGLDATGKADVERLRAIARGFAPLYRQDDQQIWMEPLPGYSLTDLTNFHWMNLAAEILIGAYGESGALTQDEFSRLFQDILPMGRDLDIIDPTVLDFDQRRFNEGDNFLYPSNGDGLIDLDEATYMLAYLSSTGVLADRVRADVAGTCANGQGLDANGWPWMDAECFRNVFFANAMKYWDHAPYLQSFYASLGTADRQRFQQAMEAGARLHGHNDDPVNGYDTKGFGLLMQYIESYFFRYDTNGDGQINTAEALASEPTFNRLLAKGANLSPSDTKTLEAIYTYTLNYDGPPSQDIAGLLKLGIWILKRPGWDLHATRMDVYASLAIFTSVIGAGQASPRTSEAASP